MAVNAKIVCDVCGTEKKETNHWFRADITLYGDLKFSRWNYDDPWINLGSTFHLCGEQCCQKKLSEWAAKGIAQ